jgi:hypothetical protein
MLGDSIRDVPYRWGFTSPQLTLVPAVWVAENAKCTGYMALFVFFVDKHAFIKGYSFMEITLSSSNNNKK